MAVQEESMIDRMNRVLQQIQVAVEDMKDWPEWMQRAAAEESSPQGKLDEELMRDNQQLRTLVKNITVVDRDVCAALRKEVEKLREERDIAIEALQIPSRLISMVGEKDNEIYLLQRRQKRLVELLEAGSSMVDALEFVGWQTKVKTELNIMKELEQI